MRTGNFNGSILVAQKRRRLLTRDAFGHRRWLLVQRNQTGHTVRSRIGIQASSLRMAVMMLAERGKIHYDDSIANYNPFAEGFWAQGSPSDIF